MDDEKSNQPPKAGSSATNLCGRCFESRELELQARTILNGVPNGPNGYRKKHCCCKLGRHTHDDEDSSSQASAAAAAYDNADPFSRSKKVRTGANGRFVSANDDGFQSRHGNNRDNPTASTATYMDVDSGGNAAAAKAEIESSLLPGLGDDEARLCLARLRRSYYGQYYTVSKRFCSLLRSGELYRTRRGLGISEQWVYVLLSGESVWRAFSLVDGVKWRPLPPTPSDPCFSICDKESLTAGTQLLVVGREVSGHCIWGYDLVSDEWFRANQMITRRYLYASASCDVHAFVAGGVDANQVVMRSAERYDSCSGRWEALPDMIKKRKLCSGFYMDGKFYVIGGVSSDDKGKETALTCGEEFDPETGSWREIPKMCPARSDSANSSAPPLVAVVDNELFSLDMATRQLMKYCKRSNKWKDLGDVPVKQDSSSGWGVAFKAMNGQLLMIGGAIYAWKPSEEGPVNWRAVEGLVPPGTFVFNCAVMSA